MLYLIGGVVEGFPTPGRNFLLHENAVQVTEIQNTTILGPVDPAEDAVESFHVLMIPLDPLERFGHAKVGIAAGHSFDPDKRNLFAIQVKSCPTYLEMSNPEGFQQRVFTKCALETERGEIEVGTVKMPKSGITEGSGSDFYHLFAIARYRP